MGLGPEGSALVSSADLLQVTPTKSTTHYIRFNIILSSRTPSINLPYSCISFHEESNLYFLSPGYIILRDVSKLTIIKSEYKSPRPLFRNGSI
jgi:hypothetical protein